MPSRLGLSASALCAKRSFATSTKPRVDACRRRAQTVCPCAVNFDAASATPPRQQASRCLNLPVIGRVPQRGQLLSVASDAAPSHHESSTVCAHLRIQSPPPSLDERRVCQRRVTNVESVELRQRRKLLQAVDKTEAGFDVQRHQVLQALQRLEAPFERQTPRQVQITPISGNVGVAGDCPRTPHSW